MYSDRRSGEGGNEKLARTLTSAKRAPPVPQERRLIIRSVRFFPEANPEARVTVRSRGSTNLRREDTSRHTSTLAHSPLNTYCHFGRATWSAERSRDKIRDCAGIGPLSAPPRSSRIVSIFVGSLCKIRSLARWLSGANVAAVGRVAT